MLRYLLLLALACAPLAHADIDGTFDTTFDVDGQRNEAGPQDERAGDVLEAFGYVFAASIDSGGAAVLRAYTQDGQPATALYPGGLRDLAVAFLPQADLFLDRSAESVYVAGTVSSGNFALPALCRVNATSDCALLSLDYGSGVSSAVITGLAVDAAGSVYLSIALATPSGTWEGAVAKLQPGAVGGPDPGFGAGGVRRYTYSPANSSLPGGLAVDVEGRVRVAGISQAGSNVAVLAVIGLTATGENDPTFGNAGVQTLPFPPYLPVTDGGPFQGLPKIQSDPRGRWVVAATLNGGVGVARLTAAGWPDDLFGSGGLRTLQSSARTTYLSAVRALQVDGGGYPILGGRAYDPVGPTGEGAYLAGVLRLRPDGSDDCAFANAGVPPCGQFFSFNQPISAVQGLHFDAAGRLLVAGFGAHYDNNLLDGDPSLARFGYDHLFRDGLE